MAFGSQSFHSSSWGRIIETFALAQTFTIEPRPRHWQNYMFVFNPRWDMHSLRAKEIKDSPNSQAVPKILVLLKMALSGSTIAQVNLISPILTCITIVSPSWIHQML